MLACLINNRWREDSGGVELLRVADARAPDDATLGRHPEVVAPGGAIAFVVGEDAQVHFAVDFELLDRHGFISPLSESLALEKWCDC
jgi:hypothetical protein